MANKYIIQGATYNGDGAANNEAASAGAAGAWNNIGVLTGSAVGYGTLAAGDKVFIRSKTSAGADITVTLGADANYGSTAATASAWVTWVLDGGDVWSGIAGTLTYNCPSTYRVGMRNYNRFAAYAPDKWVIAETNSGASNKSTVGAAAITTYQLKNFLIDLSVAQTPHGSQFGECGSCLFENVHVKSHTRYQTLFRTSSYSNVTFVNPWIELLGASEFDPIFLLGQYGATVTIDGGMVTGVGATTGVPVANLDNGGTFRSLGFTFPYAMNFTSGVPGQEYASANFIGLDSQIGGAIVASTWSADSRTDGNYPILNATLPDSVSTGWSWKLYPSLVTTQSPAVLRNASVFEDTPATKTVTLEVQIATLFTGFNTDNIWADVSYIDNASGETRYLTTRNESAGALTSSSATWSAAIWGAVALTKYKFEVTTPTSIKQDTLITVTLFCTNKSLNANHILFVDPAVNLS